MVLLEILNEEPVTVYWSNLQESLKEREALVPAQPLG